MKLTFILKTLELLLGCLTGIIAIGGKTWEESHIDAKGAGKPWYQKLTLRGKVAICFFILTFITNLTSHLYSNYERQKAIAVAKRNEDLVFAHARQNICWVIVEDRGARANYDKMRKINGRSPYEAVILAQGHNPSTIMTIEQYELERTEKYIKELEGKLINGELKPGTSCKNIITFK